MYNILWGIILKVMNVAFNIFKAEGLIAYALSEVKSPKMVKNDCFINIGTSTKLETRDLSFSHYFS